MRVMIMKSDITYLKQPTIVDINEWLLSNTGFVAVAQKLKDKTKAAIIAFQQSDMPTKEMKKLADDNNGIILVSVSEGDINAID